MELCTGLWQWLFSVSEELTRRCRCRRGRRRCFWCCFCWLVGWLVVFVGWLVLLVDVVIGVVGVGVGGSDVCVQHGCIQPC